jgi:hypothetical protein
MSWHEIGLVRFAPARKLGGYVQLLAPRSGIEQTEYLTTIRDPRAVTFSRRSEQWRRAAEEIADRSKASLKIEEVPPYWPTIRGTASGGES